MAQRIEPDLQFIEELQSVGGESLKKCYQCATCSVVCPISPTSEPFPRKEMVWAQWGLKDKLTSDIDIWLCHNCGTCSDMCPRGAKPGDLLSALRNMTYRKLVGPSAFGKWMTSAKYLPFLMALPLILFVLIWIGRAAYLGTAFPTEPDGSIVYGNLFYGDYFIDPLFMIAFFFAVFKILSGTKKLIASMKPEGELIYIGEKKHWAKHLVEVIVTEILPHKKFKDCGDDKSDRKIGHLCLMFGFIALAIVTGLVAVGHWGASAFGILPEAFGHYTHTPMDQANVIKLLANLGAILLLIGLLLLTIRRLTLDDKKQSSSFYDWYLLILIWAIALTGIGSELFRLAGLKYLAFPTYFLHLNAVFMLFFYMPWSKLGHLVYRTAALTYARYIGRSV